MSIADDRVHSQANSACLVHCRIMLAQLLQILGQCSSSVFNPTSGSKNDSLITMALYPANLFDFLALLFCPRMLPIYSSIQQIEYRALKS